MLGEPPFVQLRLPNKALRIALGEFFLTSYYNIREMKNMAIEIRNARSGLERGDIVSFLECIKKLYSGLPSSTYGDIYQYEEVHCNIFYCMLWTLNIVPVVEDTGARGRADISFTVGDCAYVIELKVVDGQEGIALNQIKEKKYHSKYMERYEKVIIAGIEYDRTKGEVSWAWEEVRG